jgi:nitroreductase
MTVYEAILKRRSIRKFKQNEIDSGVLEKLVNAARLAPQGANMQPLKYLVVSDRELADKVFEHTKWAALVHPKRTPGEKERPVAYICCLCDTQIKESGWDVDAGAAIQNLILAATAEGIGSCWLGAINRKEIKQLLNIPERYHLHSIVALGEAAETPIVEDENGSVKYYIDENGTLHVPKRRLKDIIFYNKM